MCYKILTRPRRQAAGIAPLPFGNESRALAIGLPVCRRNPSGAVSQPAGVLSLLEPGLPGKSQLSTLRQPAQANACSLGMRVNFLQLN